MVDETRMSERDNIIARIREALRLPSPHSLHAPDAVLSGRVDQRRVLPAAGSSFENRVDLFAANSADLGATFALLPLPERLSLELKSLRDSQGWKRIASHRGTLTDTVCAALDLPVLLTDAGYEKRELATCDVGITECDALVAQTGSVLVSSRGAGGRALTVLPPHHVVLARRGQLVADLPEALALLRAKYHPNYPSMMSFITGPSRTGDIERILVLGAHGPKKVTVYLV